MTGKIKTGQYFKGCLGYNFQEQKGNVLDKNLLSDSQADINKEFLSIANGNARAKNKVKHFIISFHETDKQKLSDDLLRRITADYLSGMGYPPSQNQFISFKHTDTGHLHLHLVVNRIRMDTLKAVKDGHEKRISRKVMMEIEQKYGLFQTPVFSRDKATKQNKKNYQELSGRFSANNMQTDKQMLKNIIKDQIWRHNSLKDLKTGLGALGISMRLNKAKNGLIFDFDNFSVKGSSIDRSLSLGNINKHFKRVELSKQYRQKQQQIKQRNEEFRMQGPGLVSGKKAPGTDPDEEYKQKRIKRKNKDKGRGL